MKLLPCLRMLIMLIMKLRIFHFSILKYCFENYKENYYITEYIKKVSPPKGETNALQEPMEDEIAETEISLDEKKEESGEQKEEEWSSYPCLPSNESNSLTHILFDNWCA